MQKERIFGLDLLRFIAIFFVICVHFFLNTNFYSTIPIKNGEVIFSLVALRWLFYICVPLFILLTGYLNCHKEPNKKYYQGLKKILISYLFISLVTIFIRIFILKEEQVPIAWLISIFNFTGIEYAWYVEMYLGLFLLIPFLNILFKNLTKKQKIVLTISLILMTSLPSFLNSFTLLDTNLNILPDYWLLIYPLTYYFIGAFIREYQPKISKKFLLISIITTLFFQTLSYVLLNNNELFSWNIFGNYGSFLTLIISVLFFLLIYDINLKNEKLKKIITRISLISFDMFLLSYIVDKTIYPKISSYINRPIKYIVALIPTAIIIFICTYILSEIKNFIFTIIQKSKKTTINEK